MATVTTIDALEKIEWNLWIQNRDPEMLKDWAGAGLC